MSDGDRKVSLFARYRENKNLRSLKQLRQLGTILSPRPPRKPQLLQGVYAMGFNRPSKIQENALPMMLAEP